MRVFEQIAPLRAYLRAAREDDKAVGFVPTMGALHEGHVALMKKARAECDVVVVSVFVNPTQFGPGEDFQRYPRDHKKDSRVSQQAGVDAVFFPSAEEIYPKGPRTSVDVPELAKRWEGDWRPGHFSGVATVCAKLFNIIQPERVYFGQKDYQQLKVIERMVADLHISVKVVSVPTVREHDGMALSSRNIYLTHDQRRAAQAISRSLTGVSALFLSGERDAKVLEEEIVCTLAAEPKLSLQYAAVVDQETLEPLDRVQSYAAVLIAAKVGDTRLIDNILLQDTTG